MARSGWSRRKAVPFAAASTVFAAFAAMWLGGLRHIYMSLLTGIGVPAFRFPFLDTQAVLAAIQCRRAGINVYLIDPCDALGRIHVYSPLWLRADVLPVTTQWTPWVGLGLVALFLASLALLPQAPGRFGGLLMATASVSPPVLFAMERGNIDLLMFAFAATRPWRWNPTCRAIGYLLTLLAAALKYYPVVVLVLALRERPFKAAAVLLGSAALLGTAVLLDLHEVLHALRLVPQPSFFAPGFGARDLPYGLAVLFGWPPAAAAGLLLALVLAMVSGGWLLARGLRPSLAALPDDSAAFLLVGAALIVGCFLTAQSIQYRDILMLFLLPGLVSLSNAGGRAGKLFGYTLGVLMAILWLMTVWWISPSLRAVLWALKEAGWWWLATMCSAVVWNAVQTSPLVRICWHATGHLWHPGSRPAAVRYKAIPAAIAPRDGVPHR